MAHSFGTYIAAQYLLGFWGAPPVPVDTLILTGSIINENRDLGRFNGAVATIVNEVAPNDTVVGWASYAAWRDNSVGQSGRLGFAKSWSGLEQRTSEIFNHTNVIRRNVVSRRWLPILEANIDAVDRQAGRGN